MLLADGFLGIPWAVLALIAFAIAGVFLVVDTAGAASGLRWVVMRWFHSLCWGFLGASALAMSQITPIPSVWAPALAIAGGVTYAVFIVTTVTSRSA